MSIFKNDIICFPVVEAWKYSPYLNTNFVRLLISKYFIPVNGSSVSTEDIFHSSKIFHFAEVQYINVALIFCNHTQIRHIRIIYILNHKDAHFFLLRRFTGLGSVFNDPFEFCFFFFFIKYEFWLEVHFLHIDAQLFQ